MELSKYINRALDELAAETIANLETEVLEKTGGLEIPRSKIVETEERGLSPAAASSAPNAPVLARFAHGEFKN